MAKPVGHMTARRAVGNTIVFCKAKTRSGVLSIDVVEDAIDDETILFGLLVGRRGQFQNPSHILLVKGLIQPY